MAKPLWVLKILPLLLAGIASGCGGAASISTQAARQTGPQTYMTPVVEGGSRLGAADYATAALAVYTIDDTAKTFAQSTYAFTGTQEGIQVNNSGTLSPLSRGLLSLGTTYSYPYGGTDGSASVCVDPSVCPLTGSWAVELAGQAGGLVQLLGQPVAPMVAAQSCPSFTTAKTFQFVTLPAALANNTSLSKTWNAIAETAYGSVNIGSNGSTVSFNNIQQFTLTGGTVTSYATSVAGSCSSTYYGYTISVPGQLVITNPGNGQTETPSAIVGIGPSGLLVESNGNGSSTSAPFYQDALGAGTGAIGLPKPSSQLDITSLIGAQYLGFLYGAGNATVAGNSSSSQWSSSLASFGFPSLPSSCPTSVASPSSNMIYGGDFPTNSPADIQAYGNCDFGIDLGKQDPANNGLFPGATVWIAKSTKNPYPVPAVAIAGQLNDKFAIFVIGLDTTGTPNQPWGIYLLQSN